MTLPLSLDLEGLAGALEGAATAAMLILLASEGLTTWGVREKAARVGRLRRKSRDAREEVVMKKDEVKSGSGPRKVEQTVVICYHRLQRLFNNAQRNSM